MLNGGVDPSYLRYYRLTTGPIRGTAQEKRFVYEIYGHVYKTYTNHVYERKFV